MTQSDAGSVRTVASGGVPWLPSLIERARIVDGQPPFSDGSLVELATGARTAWAIAEVAIALVARSEAEFVVDPDARRQGLGTTLLEALIAQNDATGTGTDTGSLLIWSHGDHPGARALATKYGFTAVRRLLHLRADVADTRAVADLSARAAPSPRGSVTLTGFRPGVDDTEWLELNALVFAEHPEQGGVSQADLDLILAEPWFLADDFLLLRAHDGTLLGYCWLKIEGSGEKSTGEFYVVGVHPNSAGHGLGRVLVEAGLARLRVRGIRSAHLYVEADNLAAVHLYRSYGFVDDAIDVQYLRRSES